MDIGGLFVVWPLEGIPGRVEADEGRGGGGRLPVDWGTGTAPRLFPTPCWFRAAMRAESDVN